MASQVCEVSGWEVFGSRFEDNRESRDRSEEDRRVEFGGYIAEALRSRTVDTRSNQALGA